MARNTTTSRGTKGKGRAKPAAKRGAKSTRGKRPTAAPKRKTARKMTGKAAKASTTGAAATT